MDMIHVTKHASAAGPNMKMSIARNACRKGLSFEDLLQRINKPRATLYRHLHSLVDSGYLAKKRDPRDARRNILAIAN